MMTQSWADPGAEGRNPVGAHNALPDVAGPGSPHSGLGAHSATAPRPTAVASAAVHGAQAKPPEAAPAPEVKQ